MSTRVARSRMVLWLGTTGSLIGVVAGLVQIAYGTDIPEWTGNKQAPVPLGLLTIGLSLLAGLGAIVQRRQDLSIGKRAAAAFGQAGPGLLCLSTVGRLWYLPALLLVTAGILTIDNWRHTFAAVAENWLRVLLSALGVCELLMAASSAPVALVLGAAGGAALIVAAWLPTPNRVVAWALIAGSLPFAVIGWVAVVPVLVTAEAAALTLAIHHRSQSRRVLVGLHQGSSRRV